LLDRRKDVAERARGRFEGFASKKEVPFRELGQTLDYDRMAELCQCRLIKVRKLQAAIDRDAGNQHHDKKSRRREHDSTERPNSTDAKDAADAQAGDEEKGLEAEQGPLSLVSLPHGLYGALSSRKDRSQAKRQENDGFMLLRANIKDSAFRVSQVKTDMYTPTSIQKTSEEVDALSGLLLSAGAGRPQSGGSAGSAEDSGGAFLTGVDLGVQGPQSARGSQRQAKLPLPPVPQSARGASQRAKSSRLPALADYLASPGSAGASGAGGGGEPLRSDVQRMREIIKEVLPLPAGITLKGHAQDEAAGGTRKGRNYVRRRLERELDQAWQNRAAWKRVNAMMTDKEAQEILKTCSGNDDEQARLERILDLSTQEDSKGQDASGVGAGQGADGTGSVRPEASTGDGIAAADKRGARAAGARGGGADAAADEDELSKVLQGGGLRPGSDEQARARDGNLSVAKAPARQRAIQRKAMEQLREPDPVVSPIAKLRSAVQGYQASRDAKKAVLEEKLSNRPDPLEKLYHHSAGGLHGGSRGSPHADLDLGDVRQGPWYRGLLLHVRHKLDSKTPSKALHLIMDSVKQVLDQGFQFDAEAYFKVLAQIEVGDVVGPVASLLVTMLAGIPGVEPLELPPWFEQRSGDIPPEILEAIAESSQ